MAKTDGVFIYIGTYPSEAVAQGDYDMVKDLHTLGAVGSYDAAVITKDDDGKVHVNKDETSTRRGAWGGVAAGALVGLLFPPSLIASAAVGGALGGVSGHLWKGLSRSDVKEFGEPSTPVRRVCWSSAKARSRMPSTRRLSRPRSR